MFISFEGVDQCGKTTISKLIYDYFAKKNIRIHLSREPGGEIIAEKIRAILLAKNHEILPWTEALLYIASRYQNYFKILKPKLDDNYLVICDRFLDSTLAYQGNARNLDIKALSYLQTKILGFKNPDLTIVLTLNYQEMKKRFLTKNKNRLDIAMEEKTFFNNVVKFYQNLAKNEPKRVVLVDASLPITKVFQKCLAIINKKRQEND